MSGPSNTVTTTNLLMGPGALYHALTGAVEPADGSVNSAPASSAWTDVGGTYGGVDLSIDQTYKELEVDQVVQVVGRRKVKEEVKLKTMLAEPTLVNLKALLNDADITSGTVGAVSFSYLEPVYATSATQPTYRAAILDGWAPGGNKRRRVILRRILSIEAVETKYKKDDQTLFSVTFGTHYVSTSIAPWKVIDEV